MLTKVVLENLEGRGHLEYLGIDGNKIGCKEMGLDIVGWLCLDQDRVQW